MIRRVDCERTATRAQTVERRLATTRHRAPVVCLIIPTVGILVGNGGMDIGDYYWGLYRGYYIGSIPPFPTKHQTAYLPQAPRPHTQVRALDGVVARSQAL